MLIGVPKEIKNNEFRVGLTPKSASELIHHGHQVYIEKEAGTGSGFSDLEYQQVGATILKTPTEIFDAAELIIKVKEPQACERSLLKAKHTLFTYLHLAPDLQQAEDLLASQACSIAYETITNASGQLPLLLPMSEIAGRMSVLQGAYYLQKSLAGRGVLISGAPGVEPATVVIIGAGVVGSNALQIASGMGARVLILDKNIQSLRVLEQRYGNRIQTFYANRENLVSCLKLADIVIGAVLVAGDNAPKLISRKDLSLMKPHSVIVDVAIDQGGCFETSRPTTHQDPVYSIDNITHYCVANMPGAFPRTATEALNNATLPYALELADKGIQHTLLTKPFIREGLHTWKGQLCNEAVAKAQNRRFVDAETALKL